MTVENIKFHFSDDNLKKAQEFIKQYPEGKQRSAVLPLLYLAQHQANGWLPIAAIEYVADLLDLPTIRVLEVATFYTMFNLNPVGKNHIQVCGTTPCWLRGSEQIMQSCLSELGIKVGETTKDQLFTVSEVECLGACVNAPIVQINNDYFEDLTQETMIEIIKKIKKNQPVNCGSQIGRTGSAPKSESKNI